MSTPSSAQNDHLKNQFLTVSAEDTSVRLDVYLQRKLVHSRTYFQKLIDQGLVQVNNTIILKHGHTLKEDDEIQVIFPELPPLQGLPITTDLGVHVLFEHPDFLIVFKPAGLMVHAAPTSAAAGEPSLVDWLINHFKEIAQVGSSDRPGIVHRLDKDTSGIILIARNNVSHAYLSNLFKDRTIEKNYIAVVEGKIDESGIIEFPISRDPALGHRMTHKITFGRPATTYYTARTFFSDTTLVDVHPVTGRTHQIRVHFSAIKHPIIGDAVYGKSSKLIARQALHAYSLSFFYKEKYFSFSCGLPADMRYLLDQLSALDEKMNKKN